MESFLCPDELGPLCSGEYMSLCSFSTYSRGDEFDREPAPPRETPSCLLGPEDEGVWASWPHLQNWVSVVLGCRDTDAEILKMVLAEVQRIFFNNYFSIHFGRYQETSKDYLKVVYLFLFLKISYSVFWSCLFLPSSPQSPPTSHSVSCPPKIQNKQTEMKIKPKKKKN